MVVGIRTAIVVVRLTCVLAVGLCLGRFLEAVHAVAPWAQANSPGHSLATLSNPNEAKATALSWLPTLIVSAAALLAAYLAARSTRRVARWLTYGVHT